MTEHIVAVFKSDVVVAAAEKSLESIGVPRTAIRRYEVSSADVSETVPTERATSQKSGGFWAWLYGDDAMSQTTRAAYTHDAYERKVAAGNVVVSASVDDSKIHDAITALEAHDPIEIDEHSDEMSEASSASSMAPIPGATATGQDYSTGAVAQPAATGVTAESLGGPTMPVTSSTTSETIGMPAGTAPITATTSTTGTVANPTDEQVISLAEEQLQVGKRTVDRGTTRIRRYVVEKPVEEQVTLRSERVVVERRRPLEGTEAPGAGAFEERIVELRETTEEPVVAKTAQVVEEVVIGREATERTETVKDTVRREEVEVTKDGEVKP